MGPAMADIIDSIVVSEKRRDDASTWVSGLSSCDSRMPARQSLFWLVHETTPISMPTPPPPRRNSGQLAHGRDSRLFFLLGALVFYKLNTLDVKQIAKNKAELPKWMYSI